MSNLDYIADMEVPRRYITHVKKLKEREKTLPALFERLKLLEDKLGPVLLQLPPH